MESAEGGCLCGELRYRVPATPLWVTVCYCRFCQRATGAAGMIEPIYERDSFRVTSGTPSVFTLPSEGSGQDIHVHFCDRCGTKIALTFARWPDRAGIYSGTLDDPAALPVTPENTKHIFLDEARPGTLIPPGFATYRRHATLTDGTPVAPTVFDAPTWL
ncbi:GFA family protein [Psychromarinibacter sp. C21-152]|uniref:GFA family protein n=1 Tax=Psychromarinibacter sediminicola TaxID=3033385 RepID=A0AAE3T7V5_9RHOB|nr:GFA family protein [Psychromarinibacter sediminicola]MDF0600113.1 GFA family protein [Psychromarinibacter sediminicola]